MARKTFSSDYVHALPKGRREPYRLWFEYLKLAQKLVPEQVNVDRRRRFSSGIVNAGGFAIGKVDVLHRRIKRRWVFLDEGINELGLRLLDGFWSWLDVLAYQESACFSINSSIRAW